MSFEFDCMFKPNTPQSDIHGLVEELILGLPDGCNTCFMAYGQTGAGKSWTIIGNFKVDYGEEDVMPQVHLAESGGHLLAARELF